MLIFEALQRRHIDDETIANVAFDGALIRFFDALNRDEFDVRRDAALGAVVEHFLRFGEAANSRSGEAAIVDDEGKRIDSGGFFRHADQNHRAAQTQQIQIRVQIVGRRRGVEDEVKSGR